MPPPRTPAEDATPPVVWPPRRNALPMIEVTGLNLWYGAEPALRDVAFDVYPQEVLALVGPSGSGKSSALRALNRMNDQIRGARRTGTILLDGADIHARGTDPTQVRKRFGWVAQKPNPFPRSIFENVAYAARLHGMAPDHGALAARVEGCLRQVGLWEEVADVLHTQDGTALSGGQQQRLCVARALAYDPDVLLMDEPTSSVGPAATEALEDLMIRLRADHGVVLVTHSLAQARRVADRVAVFHAGRLVEIGPTQDVLGAPRHPKSRAFLAGTIG